MAKMRIAGLIPAYNEAAHIQPVLKACQRQLAHLLVFDDGSTDNTAALARQVGARVAAHAQNCGKGQALFDGLNELFERGGYDAVIMLDADGQHLPGEIPLFVQALEAGAAMVIGNRMACRQTMPLVNWYTNIATSLWVSFLAGRWVHDSQVGFRALTAAAWREIRDKIVSRNFDFESEMLICAGRAKLTIKEVPISTVYGTEVSKISPWLDTWRFVKLCWRLLFNRA